MKLRRQLWVEVLESRLPLAVSGLDPTFGDQGVVIDGFVESASGGATAYDVEVLSDGKILAAGDRTIDRYLPDGQRDPTFGLEGRTGRSFYIKALAVQADGKFVVAGGARWYGTDFYVSRYLSNGQLDLSFGKAGTAIVDLGESDDLANDVQVDSMGRIVVAGSSGRQMALLRLTSTGAVDRSFGVGGRVIAQWNDQEVAHTLQLLPSGQILVAGTTTEELVYPARSVDAFVARFHANGSIDTSFGQAGQSRVSFLNNSAALDQAAGLTILSDGKIMVASITNSNLLGLARFTSSGVLDKTFSGDGWLIQSGQIGPDVTILQQPDGRLVVQTLFGVLRFQSSGDLDSTWTGNTGAAGSQRGMALQPDGKVILASGMGNMFAVRRLTSTGAADVSFGVDGVVASRPGSSDDEAGGSAVGPDGKIVVVGSSQSMFAVARYLPDGRLDNSFAQDGRLLIPAPAGTTLPNLECVLIQPDGKIVVAGTIETNVGDLIVMRFNSDGTLDRTFSNDGMVITTIFTGGEDRPSAMLLQPDGKIVVSVNTYWGGPLASLVRYNANGSLDVGFSTDGISTMATTGAVINDIALQADGRILGVGYLAYGRQSLLMTRFKSNGAIDSTFGQSGKIVAAESSVVRTRDMEVLSDGRFYVIGNGQEIERYFADGTRDDTFQMNVQSYAIDTDYYPEPAYFQSASMTTLADGRLALAGMVGQQAVVRVLRGDGTLDESFAGNGDWIARSDQVVRFNQLHRLPGNGLLVTGTWGESGFEFSEGDFMLARFTLVQPAAVTTTVSLSASGQVVIADRWSHDDFWSFARTDTEIIVTDLSRDRRVAFTVVGLPEVGGDGTKQIRIPLSLLESTRKALVISAGLGDDRLAFSDSFDAPSFGMFVRGGEGADAIDLSAYTVAVSWVLSGVDSGSARPLARVPINFTDVEKLFGGSKVDTFRLLYEGSNQTLAIDGGAGQDVLQLSADQDMRVVQHLPVFDRYLVVGVIEPQEYAVRSIEIAQITTGASDNQLDFRDWPVELRIKAGAGNDLVMTANLSSTVDAQEGDDIVVGGGTEDVLSGGAGNDLLVGMAGMDRLSGNSGRDVLVGGRGPDWLAGGEGDDLLIGGTMELLSFPQSHGLRQELLSKWFSSSSYTERVRQLSSVGVGRSRVYKLTYSSNYRGVEDDQDVDTFYGQLGQDWYFANLTSETQSPSAGLRDRSPSEQLNAP